MSDFSFTAAACALARSLWVARVRAYDLACISWEDLDAPTKHLYVQQAGDILKANRPIDAIDPPASPLFDAMVSRTRREFQVIK